MCGIIAFYSKENNLSQDKVEIALSSLAHRGPDGKGIYLSQDKRIGLGHVRLSIMDTVGGSQPMYNENKSLVLVANGEFYNFEKIRFDLTKLGHQFKSQSDSEIALHLFEEYGLNFIEKVRGEFSFILYDKKKNELFAFRDRFGIKPLFYSIYENNVYISSEIKALFSAGVQAKWDEDNIFQSLHFASLENSTIYQNIHQVPPGHFLSIKNNKLEISKYWDTHYPAKSKLSIQSEVEAINHVREKLEESIKIRTRSDVPIACYLSGGIDSSTVLGYTNKLASQKIPAFTISFDHHDYDESVLANKMCDYVGSPFYAIKVTNQDFADVFSDAVEKSEMPFYNGHAPARFILSREVKKAGYKVVLGGEGADELFAGYHFSQMALQHSLEGTNNNKLLTAGKILTRLIKTPHEDILKIKNISKTLYWVAKVLGFPHDLATTLIARYEKLNEFKDHQFLKKFQSVDPYSRFLKQFIITDHLSHAPFHIVLHLWMKSHFPQYVLAAERLDMAHAVELRLPFLDHELFDVTKKLPASLLYKNNLNKYLLREISKDVVCPEVISTLKKPFISPPSTLGNGNPLFELFCDLLTSEDFKNVPFFDHQFIKGLLPKIKKMDHIERAPYDPVLYYLSSLAVLSKRYRVS